MPNRSRRIGQRVGEYRLVRALGSGGAGEVFAAVHEVIGSRVVIKLLRPDRAGSVQRGRLLGEARALALLAHPGIVKLLHAATLPDGTPYLVLAPLGGMTLRQRLRQAGGRLPLRPALGVLQQVAEALAYAHDQGVLHRDVKPENLIVQRDRLAPGGLRVTLIDFGLAKILSPRAPQAPGWDPSDTCLETADGAVLGTPPYRAPEQGAVAVPTPAQDAFAVGVLAWELLTGSRLATAPAPADAATLAALHPEVAPLLLPLVGGLLAPLPEQRPARLAGVAAQLGELLRQPRLGSPAHRPRSTGVAGAIGSLARKKTAQLFGLLHPRIAPLLLFLTLVAGLMWTLPHLLNNLPGPPGRPPPGPIGRAAQSALLVLAQPQLATITDPQIAAALPPGTQVGERVNIVPLPISNPEQAVNLEPERWEEAAAAQEALFRARIAPRLGAPDPPRLAYFGMAPIPLVVHLGSLLGGLAPIEIYQHHRGRSDWRWERTAAAAPLQIHESGVPTSPQRGARTVVVRIATSFFILPEDTRMVLPGPAATSAEARTEIEIALAKPDPDALRSPEDIAEVADRFRRAMDAVAVYLPDVQVVHLFAAVPAGLALRLGMELRPNVHPRVQTYQFGKQLSPHYRAALLIRARPDAAPGPAATRSSAPVRPPEESMVTTPKTPSKIEQRLERFVDWLKPDAGSEATIRRQADEIRKAIRDQASADGLIVRETPSAGSFAKNTGLRRHVTGGSAVEGQDVDLHFVLSPRTRDDEVLDRLLDRFYGYAQRAYPQRPPNKSRTKSSVKLEFVGTKLSYDLVPLLIAPEYGDGYQWLLRSDEKRLTSVTRHVEFTRSRTRRSNSPELPGRVKFNECVRLLKWWREFRMKNDRRSIPNLPSIVIDMLAAYAFDKRLVRATYSETLYDWFDFLHAAVLRRQRISFTDYPLPPRRPHAPATPWMVIDPVDPSNNLTRKWIDQHVDELAGWLLQGRTDLGKAIDLDRRNNPQESLHYLVRLFGPPFRSHCDPPAEGAGPPVTPAPPSSASPASLRPGGDYADDYDDDD